MTFSVLFRPKAARSLRKLQRSFGTRIQESLKVLERSPEVGEQLKPSKFWEIRVGDYRVIYEIDKASNRVIVLFVGHRKNVYDEFSRLV
ncbi:MAG: type II toxin-antitoxin system RelE/ParE family toxin [Nitrososphaerota archaeon]|nr:type II toxin-antitoxin system RelE/ParE family toxin [Nitrososphaerota archaeon]